MSALAFWKAVVGDKSNFLERVIALLDHEGIRYCVIGGVGVNAYAAPMVTEDLDIVIAVGQIDAAKAALAREFRVHEFEHSYNAYDPGSKLQVQVQLDPALSRIVERAAFHDVMDLRLPVAEPRDLIRLKIAAAVEPKRRASKRGKDALDIARLLMAFPELRDEIPDPLWQRIEPLLDTPD
jgi:hypothetical protein